MKIRIDHVENSVLSRESLTVYLDRSRCLNDALYNRACGYAVQRNDLKPIRILPEDIARAYEDFADLFPVKEM